MRAVYRIDRESYYVEDVVLNDGQQTPEDCVEEPLPVGIFLPAKFENGVWASLKSQEEIDAILNAPRPKTQIEIIQETVDQLVLANLMG